MIIIEKRTWYLEEKKTLTSWIQNKSSGRGQNDNPRKTKSDGGGGGGGYTRQTRQRRKSFHPRDGAWLLVHAIKQKRLTNRDKNPATTFFLPLSLSLSLHQENSVRSNQNLPSCRRSSNKSEKERCVYIHARASFVCFKRHLFSCRRKWRVANVSLPLLLSFLQSSYKSQRTLIFFCYRYFMELFFFMMKFIFVCNCAVS